MNLEATGSPTPYSEILATKSCEQIVAFLGDGKLRDGGSTATEFRQFLADLSIERLHDFAGECLTAKFPNAPYALQDIVNEAGRRLGFTVEDGRYRGTQGEIGFDGLWRSRSGQSLIVEVKTTDAYRINLDTPASYLSKLVHKDQIDEADASILLVVGRQDTGDLEAQIRGSRHAWDIRVISVDALFRMLAVKEQMSDWGASTRINQLLRPMEFTRVDGIIDVLFETTQDVEDQVADLDDSDEGDKKTAKGGGSYGPSGFDHETARASAIRKLESKLDVKLRKQGRVFWSSADNRVNVVCLSSQPYDDGGGKTGFWYGVKPGQREFLEQNEQAYMLFVCGLDLPAILIPAKDMLKVLGLLKTTPPQPEEGEKILHWHVIIQHYGASCELKTPPAPSGTALDASRYKLG